MTLLEIVIAIHDLVERSKFKEIANSQLILSFTNPIEPNLPEDIFLQISPTRIEIDLAEAKGLYVNPAHFSHAGLEAFSAQVGIQFFKENDYLVYDPRQKKVFSSNVNYLGLTYFEDQFFALKLLEELQRSEVIAYDDARRKDLVLISPHKGKYLVSYEQLLPIERGNLEIEINYTLFTKRNTSDEYTGLLNDQICQFLPKTNERNKFESLAINLPSIMEETRKSYRLYLSKFDFSKLNEGFRKEKEKYFENLREIVSQIITKVVSIPVAISAAAISIHDLKDEPIFGELVLLTFLIYSVFTSYLLKVNYQDVQEIRDTLQGDIEKIIQVSGSQSNAYAKDRESVEKRISNARICILLVQILLAVLALAAIYFSGLIYAAIESWLVNWGIVITATVHAGVVFWTVRGKLKG